MNAQQSSFLQKVAVPAIASMRSTGVPASVTIAQAIIESSRGVGVWGDSPLVAQANNYFGIKATDDSYVEFRTPEFVRGQKVYISDRFEKYASVEACFAAHARLLSTAKRYAPCMVVRGNAESFAHALQQCGYSTSPTYAQTLINLIHTYDLTQYDVQAAQ